MGLEGGGKRPIDQSIPTLHTGLVAQGWTDSDYGFSLARLTGGIDVIREGRRVLYYPASRVDHGAYTLLSTLKLPVFKATIIPIRGISSVELPYTARALDSMKFPDQAPQPGYFGSIEIMEEVARFLGRIYLKTKKIPQDLKLGKLAMVPGDRDNVRLIPPLNLTPADNWEVLVEELLADLNVQDPDHGHAEQIKYFKEAFERTLKDEKR